MLKRVLLFTVCLFLLPTLHSPLSVVLAADDSAIREMGVLLSAVKANPDDADAHFRLGVIYTEQDSFDQALSEFKEVLRIKPKLAEAHYNLAVLYDQKGLEEEAVHELIETVTLRPDDADAHLLLAGLYKRQRHDDFAAKELSEVVRIRPDDIETRLTLAELFAKLDDLKGAIRQYQEIIRIDPNHASAHYDLGVLYGKKALRGTGDTEGVIPGDAFKGDFTDYDQLAIEQFQEALRIRPDNAQAHYNLGIAYLYAGKLDKTHEEHGALEGLDPGLGEKLSEKIKAVTSSEGAHVH